MRSSTFLLSLASLLPYALGHGQVRHFITSTTTYAAADAYGAADPTSPIRKLNTYGPAADFTSATITCGEGGNTPVANLAPVKPGELVTFDWGDWSSSHSGPVMTYIAACTGGCANFKGDTGNIWVKIDQDQFNPSRTGFEWGENIIRMKGGKYSLHIPDVAPGEYILRHEILGLHVAGNLMGAQFYPNCVQVKVTGSGTKALPQGIPLPGSYDPHDKGILMDLWRVTATTPNYTAPGGPVLLAAGTGDWGVEAFGGGAIGSANPSPNSPSGPSVPSTPTAPLPPVTSVPPVTSIPPVTTVPPATPTTPAQPPVQKYGQCGGQTYTGSTTCVAGTTCQVLNAFYSQCL